MIRSSLERRFTWTPPFDLPAVQKLTIGPLLCIACNDDEEALCDSFPFFISVGDSNAAPLWKSPVVLEGKNWITLRYSLSSVFKGDPMETRSLSETSMGKLTNRTHRGSGSPAVMTTDVTCSVYVTNSHDPRFITAADSNLRS